MIEKIEKICVFLGFEKGRFVFHTHSFCPSVRGPVGAATPAVPNGPSGPPERDAVKMELRRLEQVSKNAHANRSVSGHLLLRHQEHPR